MKKTLLITAFLSAFITLNSCKQSSSAPSENSADAEKIKTDGS
jgi:nitrite reductase (NO-forming)